MNIYISVHVLNALILVIGYLLIRFVICKDDYERSGSGYGPSLDGCFGTVVMMVWTIMWLIVFYMFDLTLI